MSVISKYFKYSNILKGYPNDFKRKVIKNDYLEVKDFVSLTKEQIDNILPYVVVNYSLDIDFYTAVQLYKYSSSVYEDIKKLIVLNNFTKNDKEIISNTQIQNIEKVVYDLIRKDILENKMVLDKTFYTQKFIFLNDDIFLTRISMSNELREKYYHKNLSYEQYILNYEIFKDTIFLSDDLLFLKSLLQDYGFTSLLDEYPNVIKILYNKYKFNSDDFYNDIGKNILNDPNDSIKDKCLNALKKVISENLNIENKLYLLAHNLQDELKITIIEWFRNIQELMDYSKGNCILNNKNYRNYLNHLGIDNIIRIYKETNIDIFNYIYLTFNEPKINSYEEFIRWLFFKFLINYNYNYDVKRTIINTYKDYLTDYVLPTDIDNNIQDKYYNSNLSSEDVEKYRDVLKDLNVNIAYGFKDAKFLKNIFLEDDVKVANEKRINIYIEYCKINNNALKNTFENFIINNYDSLDKDIKLRDVLEILKKLEYSNSNELRAFCGKIATLVLNTQKPMESLNKIEEIFLKNNLPFFGKMFKSFQLLYSDLSRFKFDNIYISPQLSNLNLVQINLKNLNDNDKRFIIIYNDLLRIAVRSGTKDLIDYLINLEKGNELFIDILNNKVKIELLSRKDRAILETFISHLETLYNNTKEGIYDKQDDMSLQDKLFYFSTKFKPTERYDLKDRIVRSFTYFAGYKDFNSLKSEIIKVKENADLKGRNRALELQKKPFSFEVGDFVRGIGDLKAFGSSLNVGNFSKEHLLAINNTSDSDFTPLDVDFSKIKETGSIYNSISNTVTNFSYGNIYVILKKDNPNIYFTKYNGKLNENVVYNPNKMEMFGQDNHYGIRTGFAFTDIDYILYKKTNTIIEKEPYDKNGNVNYFESFKSFNDLPYIKFEIARNGYYIPVIDFSGKLIFTPEEYDYLRSKMSGLKYYGENIYQFSSLLNKENEFMSSKEKKDLNNLLKSNKRLIDEKRNKIYKMIAKVLNEFNLEPIFGKIYNLEPNKVEILDTGSTGRNTNIPGEGDFDFVVKFDQEIMMDSNKLMKIKRAFEKETQCLSRDAKNFKADYVKIDGINEMIKLEMTFTVRTDKIAYSTEECVSDRLDTIKKQDKEKYNLIIKNIIEAKKFLKDRNIYAKKDGGFGGIGVENWILQNGGSFKKAIMTFLEVAYNHSYEDFSNNYAIWDFGANHLSFSNNFYQYDNFTDNLSQDVYNKMVLEFKNYMKFIDENEIKNKR